MTLHINYEHKCQRCGTNYIPFDTDVPCPKCGLVESERYDLVGTAVESTLYNLKRYGSYKPWAWRESTFGDRILLRLFHVLQADYDAGGVPPFEERVDTWVNTVMNWGDEVYLAPSSRTPGWRAEPAAAGVKRPAARVKRARAGVAPRRREAVWRLSCWSPRGPGAPRAHGAPRTPALPDRPFAGLSNIPAGPSWSRSWRCSGRHLRPWRSTTLPRR